MATVKQTRKTLTDNFGETDDRGHVTYSKGLFTIRRGFYYRHGATAGDFAEQVLKVLPAAEVIACGEHDAPFRGGEGVRRNSHWWVQIRV